VSLASVTTRAAAALVPRLSFPVASNIGRTLGSLVWALDARHRKVAVDNLAIANRAELTKQFNRVWLRILSVTSRYLFRKSFSLVEEHQLLALIGLSFVLGYQTFVVISRQDDYGGLSFTFYQRRLVALKYPFDHLLPGILDLDG